MALRFDFLKDLDEDARQTINSSIKNGKLLTSEPLYTMPIDLHSISFDSEFFHAVEAENRTRQHNRLISIRIIANIDGSSRGINVIIPYRDEAMYAKFRDLRYQIRNNDWVSVTFPQLFVKSLSNRKDLFLWAEDFRIKRPDESILPFPPKIEI